MCGLVSLVVVAEVLGLDVTTELLLETGRSRGFTLQGEMFSAFSLAELAREMLEVEARVEAAELLLDTSWLLELLQSGGLVVLPYDCQPDSSVCLAGGHRALRLGGAGGLHRPPDTQIAVTFLEIINIQCLQILFQRRHTLS